MKTLKLALFLCLGLGTALLAVGCTPANQKVSEQTIDLPYSVFAIFKITHPNLDQATMKTVRKGMVQCYVAAAKPLDDDKHWGDMKAMVSKLAKLEKGKHYDSRMGMLFEAAGSIMTVRGGANAKNPKMDAASDLLGKWMKAADPCAKKVVKDATQGS